MMAICSTVTRPLLAVVATLLTFSCWAGDEVTASFHDDNTDRVPEQTLVPVYPRKALRDRIEGVVQVCYYVDKKGRPYSVAVRKSTHRAFERPSLLAVRASRYMPLEPGKKNSGIKTCRTFSFQLDPVVEEPATNN
jgi:TonB family protein